MDWLFLAFVDAIIHIYYGQCTQMNASYLVNTTVFLCTCNVTHRISPQTCPHPTFKSNTSGANL